MGERNFDPQGPDTRVPSQRVTLPGVELKSVRGDPVGFGSNETPTGYSGTLCIAYKDLSPVEFWRLQRTLKAGHQVNVNLSVEYIQGHLDQPPNGQLPIPQSAYRPVGDRSEPDAQTGHDTGGTADAPAQAQADAQSGPKNGGSNADAVGAFYGRRRKRS